MFDQKINQVAGELQYRNIGIEVKTVDTFALENNMLVEYSIDVRHWCLLGNYSLQEDTMLDLIREDLLSCVNKVNLNVAGWG